MDFLNGSALSKVIRGKVTRLRYSKSIDAIHASSSSPQNVHSVSSAPSDSTELKTINDQQVFVVNKGLDSHMGNSVNNFDN